MCIISNIIRVYVYFIGIDADLYTPPANTFQTVDDEPENKCFCPGNEYCPPKGLQNISPCQYGKSFDPRWWNLISLSVFTAQCAI